MADQLDNFEEVYKTHYKMLRNAAENIIDDHDASHDIVQEVFVKLWHKKDEISAILNIKAYLFRSVINSSLTYLENNKNKIKTDEFRLASQSSTDSKLIAQELESKIQIALKGLPPKCKAIFVLSRFEGLKNKEIAEHLNLSLKTVENQMGIALKRMKEDLKPYLTREFLVMLLFFSVFPALWQEVIELLYGLLSIS
ncbi:MAG: RNA polymerase sigma-70 factor [Bacteroidia bacterium]|nr:RNA polymerase sigma-70 factor [Bacteroidia bacterium]